MWLLAEVSATGAEIESWYRKEACRASTLSSHLTSPKRGASCRAPCTIVGGANIVLFAGIWIPEASRKSCAIALS